MALQAITMPAHRYPAYLKHADFIQTFIFPGSCCPALSALIGAFSADQAFRLEHLEDIGRHYATTLRHWRARFHANIERVKDLGYPREFRRMWEYYLCYCEAGFAARYLGTPQMILRKTAG